MLDDHSSAPESEYLEAPSTAGGAVGDMNAAPSRAPVPRVDLQVLRRARENEGTESSQNAEGDLSPVIRLAKNTRRHLVSPFRVLAKWEGVVTEVHADSFVADCTDALRGIEEPFEAELYLNEVDPGERELVEVGAVFYWTIGYRDRRRGRARESVIVFRRLPARVRKTEAAIDEAVAALAGALGLEDEGSVEIDDKGARTGA